MAFPTTLDAPITNSTPTETVAVFGHSAQHNLIASGVTALEAKVGIDGSAVTTSHDYKLSTITSTNKAVGKASTAFSSGKIVKTSGNDTVIDTGVSIDANDDVSGLGLQNNVNLTGRNNAGSGDINILKVNTSDTITAGVNFDFPSITLTTALAPTDGGTGIDTYTKGDIVIGTGTNTVAKLGIGSNGLVLAANSATATGTAWTSAASLAGIKFGGTGADGALSISSGTTTVNLGNAAIYVLNYSSISITGTGKLAFSNPATNGTVVIIKSSGDCTLTSSATPMIDVTNCGGAGGAGGVGSSGNNGNTGLTYGFIKTNFGIAPSPYTGGAVGTFGFMDGVQGLKQFLGKYPKMFVGAGGGSGIATTVGTAGAGGNGGGCLIMEVAGAMNFTTTGGISVSGSVGADGVASGGGAGGGGGGGGGGSAFVFYNTLTAFSGTITVAGGAGGAYTSGTGGGACGGGGGSATNAGSNGTAAGIGTFGGVGGAGLEVHGLNTEF